MRAIFLFGLVTVASAWGLFAGCGSSGKGELGPADASLSDATADGPFPEGAPFVLPDMPDVYDAGIPHDGMVVDAVSNCTGGGCDVDNDCCSGMPSSLTCRGGHGCRNGACVDVGGLCPLGKRSECCVGNGCSGAHKCVACKDLGAMAPSPEECCAAFTDAGGGQVSCQ